MKYSWPFVFPPFIHLLLFCMHTCKYSYKHRIHTERKKIFKGTPRHDTGLFSTLPAQFAVFGLRCIELTLYTWLTPSSSSATITQRCQEVPVLSAVQALPIWRGTRQGLGFFSCTLMWCLWFSFVMRRESATSTSCSIVNTELFPESSTAGWDVSLEEDCLSVWRATHAIHVHMAPRVMWPCWEPTEIKLRVFNYFFMLLSFLIYFIVAHWHFINRVVQTRRQRITHIKPHGAIYKTRVKDKNHLSCPLWYVNNPL